MNLDPFPGEVKEAKNRRVRKTASHEDAKCGFGMVF